MYLQSLTGDQLTELFKDAGIMTMIGESVYSLEELPVKDEEMAGYEVSDTVLVDIDGFKTNDSFELMFYNYTTNEWVQKGGERRFGPDWKELFPMALWRYLPLGKYEQKKK